MNSKEVKEQIAKKEQEISDIKKELDEFKNIVIKASSSFINSKISDIISNQITESAELIKEIKPEKLSEVKLKLKKITDNLDSEIEKEFNKDENWAHLSYDTTKLNHQSYNEKNDGESRINTAIKKIFGLAGAVFADYEIVKPCYSGERRFDNNKWQYLNYSDKTIIYSYYCITDDLKTVVENYKNRYEDYIKKNNELVDLKKKLTEREATELWEKV